MSELLDNCREWLEKVGQMSAEEKEKELDKHRNSDEGKIAEEYCDIISGNDAIEYRGLLERELLNVLENFNTTYKDQIQSIALNMRIPVHSESNLPLNTKKRIAFSFTQNRLRKPIR